MSGQVRYIEVAERRARLAVGQRLAGAARADTPEEVAESLVALHGTDPASVFLAVGARLADAARTVPETERALYEDRTLVRMHGMRHTVFVFPTELVPVVHASTGLAVAARARAALIKDMAKAGAPDAEWLAEVEASALAALARRGEATAVELAQDEPRLREQFVYAAGKSYEGVHTVSSRLWRVLGVEGRVVRGRPLGSWTSTQFRWAVAPPSPELPVAEAQSELVRRWLAACGPATEADLKWWTGWKVSDVRRRAQGGRGGDRVGGRGRRVRPRRRRGAGRGRPSRGPRCCPGWIRRPWAGRSGTGTARRSCGPRSSTAAGTSGPPCGGTGGSSAGGPSGPTARSSGGCWTPRAWAERRGTAIEAEAARLRGWVGPTRVTPRFRTPLERELASV